MDIEFEKKNGVICNWSKSLRAAVATLKNGKYTLTIKRKTKPRTLSQNSLMWMWFACIERETGQSKDDIHDYYCSKFLQKTRTINGKMVLIVGHTRELTTVQFKEFLELIQADAASEMGILLPSPEDLYFSEFEDEFESNKQGPT